MNLQEYKDTRAEMLENAKNLLAENKADEANKVMDGITDLDTKYEKEAKAQANLNALEDKTIEEFANITGAKTVMDKTMNVKEEVVDVYNTTEYREAFMNYVVKGEKASALMNAAGPTKSTDVGILIPTEISQNIIKKLEKNGNILGLVTRTNVPGGIEIPVANLVPVASWVKEGAGSDKQKMTYGKVTFAYHKLRCAVSVTMEVANLTLGAFESHLAESIAEAIIKALEEAIIKGTGSGQPKGILAETANEGQEISTDTIDYKLLMNAEAALPEEYEDSAEWCMSKKTFMEFMGMVDTNKQPIARVDHGIDGKITRYLLGRKVNFSKHVTSFVGASATNVFAFMFNFKDYALNTAFNMGVRKYIDEETDDEVTKTAMLADGQVVNKDSLVLIKKNS